MINNHDINQAVDLLKKGELVAFATETVYGLGADATNEAAIKRIFAAKQRPATHPLIVHLASIADLPLWAKEIPPAAHQLAERYWPGPLTLILKKQAWVSPLVTAGQETVGIRIPRHPVAQALLQAFGGGIAAPSANQFTHISPTTAEAVREELGDRVSLILDGGACEIGLESTIVDMTQTPPVILRPGMLSAESLGICLAEKRETASDTRAPGMHHLHYAPLTKTLSLPTQELLSYATTLQAQGLRVALLTQHAVSMSPYDQCLSIDPHHYAHDLYQRLRALDHLGLDYILVESVPLTPEWDAIRNRLEKATAPRG